VKPLLDDRLRKARVRKGTFASDDAYGNNGVFEIKGPIGTRLLIIASDGMGWEHVSVSCKTRCPSWSEMCFVKDLFWDDEETVIQYHPPRSQYVDNCSHCLHLWKPIGMDIPLPPTILVGMKGVEL
jgi:hypothetical protein